MKNSDKILSLQRHIERVKNQAANPNPKYAGERLSAYLDWVKLEIKRTETKINALRS